MRAKNGFSVSHRDQPQIHPNQIFICGKDIQSLHARVANGLFDLLSIYKDIVDGCKTGCFLNSETTCGISLGVSVDQEDFNIAHGERRAEIDGSGSFPHSTFLIGYCNDSTHVFDTLTQHAMFHVKHYYLNVSRETFLVAAASQTHINVQQSDRSRSNPGNSGGLAKRGRSNALQLLSDFARNTGMPANAIE